MEIQELERNNRIISELIDSYRDEWQRGSGQRDKEPRRYFYVSDVGKGDREVYYHFKHPEKKRTLADKTLVLFRHGNMHHEEVQFRLREKRIVDSSRNIEYGLEDLEVDVSGRLDCFIKEKNGSLSVTEIKAKNPYGFLSEAPDTKEIDQLLFYIACAKKSRSLRQRKVNDYGYILYVEGWPISDFPYRGWKIPYNVKRIQEIKQRFKALGEAIEKEQIPQRKYERDSIECQYCRFSEYCWQGVPKSEEPVFETDKSIEKPGKELVDSAAEQYIKLKREEKDLKGKLSEIYELLMKYFKATGVGQIEKDGTLICHKFSKQTNLDLDYLLKEAKDRWHFFSKPSITLMRKAIKDGELDPEIFERAKKIEYQDKITIKEA